MEIHKLYRKYLIATITHIKEHPDFSSFCTSWREAAAGAAGRGGRREVDVAF